MKIVFFLLLSICALPLTISAPLSPFIRLPPEPRTPVLDIEGNAVVGGAKYYALVISLLFRRGGISVTNFDDSAICPTYAYLNFSKTIIWEDPTKTFRPIVFHPLNDPTGVVYQSDPIYVEFDPVDSCPTKWKLDDQNIIVAGSEPSIFSITIKDYLRETYIFSGIGIVDHHYRLGIADTTTSFYFVRVLSQ